MYLCEFVCNSMHLFTQHLGKIQINTPMWLWSTTSKCRDFIVFSGIYQVAILKSTMLRLINSDAIGFTGKFTLRKNLWDWQINFPHMAVHILQCSWKWWRPGCTLHNGKWVLRCKTPEMVDKICTKKIDMWVVATLAKDCWAVWHSLLAELHHKVLMNSRHWVSLCWALLYVQQLTLRSSWESWLHLGPKQSLNRKFQLAAEMLLPRTSWSVLLPNEQ